MEILFFPPALNRLPMLRNEASVSYETDPSESSGDRSLKKIGMKRGTELSDGIPQLLF